MLAIQPPVVTNDGYVTHAALKRFLLQKYYKTSQRVLDARTSELFQAILARSRSSSSPIVVICNLCRETASAHAIGGDAECTGSRSDMQFNLASLVAGQSLILDSGFGKQTKEDLQLLLEAL